MDDNFVILIMGAICLALGSFTFWASYTDQEWYWEKTRLKGRIIRAIIGETAFRYLCMLVSVMLIFVGIYFCGVAIATLTGLI